MAPAYSKSLIFLGAANLVCVLFILRDGQLPEDWLAFGVLAVGALWLELRAVKQPDAGPLSCSLVAPLASLAAIGLGAPAGLLLCCVLLSLRWLQHARDLANTLLATVSDLTPLLASSTALLLVPAELAAEKKLLVMSFTYAAANELAIRALYRRRLEEGSLRRRYSLTSLVASIPLVYLLSDGPVAALLLFPLLLMVQQGGYGLTLRDRKESLVTASKQLKEARTEVKQASLAEKRRAREVVEKEVDRKLLEHFSIFFSKNPVVDEILVDFVAAMERLLRPRPIIVFARMKSGFQPTRWSELAQKLGDKLAKSLEDSLLEESYGKSRVISARDWDGARLSPLVREVGPGLALPLGRYGAVYIVIDQELSERHAGLLQTIATQVGLGLQSALYRRRLSEALAQRTQALEQLKESQAQLVQSGKMAAVGQLAAGVAHELNSPLAAALLQIQAGQMRLESGKADKAKRSLEVAERTIGKAQKIIEKLLCFSHPAQQQRVEVSLPKLVEDTLEVVLPQFEKVGIQLECQVQPCSVTGDPLELQQVLTNLLLNARDAALANKEKRIPKIRLTANGGPNVTVEVADSGEGLSEEVLPRVFEPFFTTKPIGEGTGLGLSISYQLVEAHGGTLQASNSAGGGAVFTLSLPARVHL